MNSAQIEDNIQKLIKSFDKETFIFGLLTAYGLPKASITRLQKGNYNLSKTDGQIIWKKKLFFRVVESDDLHATIDNLSKDEKAAKHNPRFILVTDYQTLLAIDTKTQETLDIPINDLVKHYDFFLPWAGMEKAQHQNENPADVRAAERMAKLFDEIKKDNPNESPDFIHGLNVFLSRLLFCFFAEDTNIFEEKQFTKGIISHTQEDGSDLNQYLNKLFDVLNIPNANRKDLPAYLEAFPYVNGGLFKDVLEAPVFSRKSRKAVIDSGELDWSAINPDIFGSMIQAVVSPEHRGGLGMHYTSVPNIMKVIEPLFLNDLKEEFEKAKGDLKKLNKLLFRLQKLKIFDPACGSGNFLIIAYKELRKLEIEILKETQKIKGTLGTGKVDFGSEFLSQIQLSQFFGIEIDDFAHEIAKLSLWLAEHQMNVAFFKAFGKTKATLPLKQAGNIVHGNATRLNWEQVCPKKDGDEVYILGNPPYLGSSLQSKIQKGDMDFVFHGEKSFRNLDYIACWFLKGIKYLDSYLSSQFAFVSTNSICQGEQVAILWPNILDENKEISFAHTSFKWGNNAKSRAAVTCVIIGVRGLSDKKKYLFDSKKSYEVKNINAYLVNSANFFVLKRVKPLSDLPSMIYGNKAVYGEHLILSTVEKNELISQYPLSDRFVKQLIGASDFINGKERWCLWIEDQFLNEALKILPVRERIEKVRIDRLKSVDRGANFLANTPHRFRDTNFTKKISILVPRTTSERRIYIPIGLINSEQIASNASSVIYEAPIWVFGMISARMHMVWVRIVAGRLKTDYRYSSTLCYNTFPFPNISKSRKDEITQCVFRILEEREKHPEKTLAQLYDPDKMPEGLREAHHLNDLAVERCYRSKPFASDEERLEHLFKLYEKMIEEEKQLKTSTKKKL